MARKLAPLAGIAAVICVVVGAIIAGEPPDPDDGVREAAEFYRDNDHEQIIGSVLLAYGALLFLVFHATLWNTLRAAQPDRRASSILALAGGVLFATGLTIFAGIGFTLGDYADDLPADAIATLNALGLDLFLPAAVGIAAFFWGTALAVLTTGVLPKWLGWVTVVLAVVALTPLGWFAFLGMAIWLPLTGILLFLRDRSATRAPAAPS